MNKKIVILLCLLIFMGNAVFSLIGVREEERRQILMDAVIILDRIIAKADQTGFRLIQRSAHDLKNRVENEKNNSSGTILGAKTLHERAVNLEQVLKKGIDVFKKLRDDIKRAKTKLCHIRERLKASEFAENEKMEVIIKRAEEILDQARKAFEQRDVFRSAALMRRLKELGDDLFNYKDLILDMKRVDQAIKTTDKIIKEAEEHVKNLSDNIGQKARKLISSAQKHQELAYQLFKEQKPRRSLSNTLVAREMAMRILKESDERFQEDFKSLIEKASTLLERTRHAVEGNDETIVSKLLQEAERLYDEVLRQKASAGLEASVLKLNQSMEKCRRILKMQKAMVGNISDEIARLNNRLEKTEQILGQSYDSKALKVLEKARQHRDQAVALAKTNAAQALRQVKIAVLLAIRASDMATDADRQLGKGIGEEIARVKTLVAKAFEAVIEADAEAKALAEKAKAVLEEASELYNQEKFREALQALERANDLAFQSLKKARVYKKPEPH